MKVRVFAALELPSENKRQLAELLDKLKSAVPKGTVRWSRPDDLHLTLKFYGDVDEGQLPAIESSLRRAAARAAVPQLAIEGLGVFPNPRSPQVVWAGLTGDLAPLTSLQADIEALSTELGHRPEARPFQPHLTMGRVKSGLRPADHMALMNYLSQSRAQRLGDFVPNRLSLMRSQLRPTGAVYTVLLSLPLGEGAPAGDSPDAAGV